MSNSSPKHPFFKGLAGFTRADDTVLAQDAEESVYRWWWEYLRLSPVLWYAQNTGLKPVDSRMARVVSLCGDLSDDRFYVWWNATGKQVFAEAKRPAQVTELNLQNLQEHLFRENALYLEIPLTIRKETILNQFKKYLDQHHQGRELDLAANSQATFRLHTKRFRLRVIETGYWVLLYRLLYPDIQAWRIGDRLQIAPVNKVRLQDRMLTPKPFDMLNSLTGRYLYKARYMQLNAERDSFPNTTKIQLDDEFEPFGQPHHAAYLAATSDNNNGACAWHQWLHKNYATALKYHVIRLNRLDQVARLPDSKLRKRLPDFIAGKSDLLE